MTADEQVRLAWDHMDHFAEVAAHNIEVTIRRAQRQDWAAPENQYRDPWAELAAKLAQQAE